MRTLPQQKYQTGKRCSRHVVQLCIMAFLDNGLARWQAGTEIFLSDFVNGNGLRYYFLLGCQNDNDGARIYGWCAVQRRLHSFFNPRWTRKENEQDQRQRHWPSRNDWKIRRGRSANDIGSTFCSGSRHSFIFSENWNVQIFYEQTLERSTFCFNEPWWWSSRYWCYAASSSRQIHFGTNSRNGWKSPWAYRLLRYRNSRTRSLRFRLGRCLRLVSWNVKACAERWWRRRKTQDNSWSSRRGFQNDFAFIAPVHSVCNWRTLGCVRLRRWIYNADAFPET